MKKRVLTAIMAALMLSVSTFPALAAEIPISQTSETIGGVKKIVKVFEIAPDADPTPLTESFTQGGLTYEMESITKSNSAIEKSKDIAQEHSVTVTASKEDAARADALKALPSYIAYDEDGYSGILYPVLSTMTLNETGRTPHSGVSTTTKQYTLEYNDESLVPGTVSENGQNYTMSSVTWSDGQTDDTGFPENYIANATYTRKYSYTTVDGYEATMLYTGTVKNAEDMMQYTVTYTGALEQASDEQTPVDTQKSEHAYIGILIFLTIVILALLVVIVSQKRPDLFQRKPKKHSNPN